MKLPFTILLFLTLEIGFSQSIINWSSEYELELADFKSPETEINNKLTNYSITSGTQIEFSFHMSTFAFMFTKNFNSKVKTIFNRNSAVIIAPDSIIAKQLLRVSQYSFDLTELYARKFRKELYTKKGAFSGVDFFKPIFNDLQEKMNAENARVLKRTNFGKNENLLAEEHKALLFQIKELSDFCFDCKPPKKKKRKN